MTTNNANLDKWIYRVTPDQRSSLMSENREVFEKSFGTLLQEIRSTFDQEGLVLIRGLFPEELLDRLAKDGQAVVEAVKFGSSFTSLKFGPIFYYPHKDDDQSTEFSIDGEAFRQAALASAIPAFVARVLLQMDDQPDDGPTLRMLKDAFMAKGKEQNYCGWHVDDSGFWPVDATSNGVNVWMSLDDIPATHGGGLAVSPQSHTAEWRQHAYETIGSTKIYPPEGIDTSSELFQKIFGKTCAMADLDPDLNAKIEAGRIEFDYQKGDCLFCTRWLFHRSVPINQIGLKYYEDAKKEPALKRYTVRYELGTARTLRGTNLEPCALLDANNAGKTLDEICGKTCGKTSTTPLPFYPQCWPPLENPREQEEGMKSLALNTLPGIEVKRKQIFQEMMAAAKEKAGGGNGDKSY